MAISGLMLALAMLVQTPPQTQGPDTVEDVVVLAPSADRIDAFASALLEPARLGRNAGQIARWSEKLCVRVIGAEPTVNARLGEQIVEEFQSLNVPVNEGYCRNPNVMVVVADNATGFARVFADRYSNRMFDNRRGDMAEFIDPARPVRWQHRTRTVGQRPAGDSQFTIGSTTVPAIALSNARLALSTAEEVDRAMLVVDPRRLGDTPSRGVAAYIAFATLLDLPLQPDTTGRDTILNLFEPGGPTALTAWDRALLTGVYAMQTSQPFQVQQSQIEHTMRRVLTPAGQSNGSE